MLYLISNLFIGINPYNLKLHIFRMLSIIAILVVIYNNTNESSYLLSLLTPFSVDKIHFVHDFDIKHLNIYGERKSMLLLKDLTKDLTDFLDNLNKADNYWASLSFYPDIVVYNEGTQMHLCDPILINRDSSPLLLTNFIMSRLNLMIDSYYLDDSIINTKDAIIIVQFTEIELN